VQVCVTGKARSEGAAAPAASDEVAARAAALCDQAEAYLAAEAYALAMDAAASCAAIAPHHPGLAHLRARILGLATQRVTLGITPEPGARRMARLILPPASLTRRELARVMVPLRWHGRGDCPAVLVVERQDGQRAAFALQDVPRPQGRLAWLRHAVARWRAGRYLQACADLTGVARIGVAAGPEAAPVWLAGLRQSDLPTVLEGRDGWLFLTNDGNASDALFTGALQLPLWRRFAWWRFGRALGRLQRGVDAPRLAFVIAPSKESVRQAEYPLRRGARVVTDEVLAILRRAGVDPVFPVERLAAEPGSYCRTDTHWSHQGAFIALEACLDQFGLSGDWRGQIDFVPHEVMGDLGGKVTPPVTDAMLVARWPGLPAGQAVQTPYRSGLDSTGEIVIFTNAQAPVPEVLVVFGGSSAGVLAYLASRIFARVVRINGPSAQPVAEVIRAEGARYVICQTNERYLLRAPRMVARLQDTAIPAAVAALDAPMRARVADACAAAEPDNRYARFIADCLQRSKG
jgi:hypothetical protein